jgi:hypothetical protein
MHDQRPLPYASCPICGGPWESISGPRKNLPISSVAGRSAGMLGWLDGKGQGYCESGP